MQYVKIKDAIVEQIEAGMLSPRQKLPAERKLAESFDTTRVTLREALSLLEAEGRIYREDRRGWFISPLPLRYDPGQALSFLDMAQMQNRLAKTEVLNASTCLADKQATRLLALPAFSDVFCINRVRYLEDRPVVLVTNYVQSKLTPDLLAHDLTQSLNQLLCNQYGLKQKQVRYRIATSTLLGSIAQALRATSGTPAMVIERVHFDSTGSIIDAAIEYWRHDAISIESCLELK